MTFFLFLWRFLKEFLPRFLLCSVDIWRHSWSTFLQRLLLPQLKGQRTPNWIWC